MQGQQYEQWISKRRERDGRRTGRASDKHSTSQQQQQRHTTQDEHNYASPQQLAQLLPDGDIEEEEEEEEAPAQSIQPDPARPIVTFVKSEPLGIVLNRAAGLAGALVSKVQHMSYTHSCCCCCECPTAVTHQSSVLRPPQLLPNYAPDTG